MTQSPQRNQTKRIILIVISVLVLLLGLVIAGGITLFRSFTGTSRAAEVTAGQFMDRMRTHDYRGAYAMATPQMQAQETVSALQDVQELMEKRHGTARSRSGPSGQYVSVYNGVTSVRLTYQARFQSGTIPVVITVVKTPSGWRVDGYNFQM